VVLVNSIAVFTVWNKLFLNTRSASIFRTFKSSLETELFTSAYYT